MMKKLFYLVPLLCVLCVGQGILIRSGPAAAVGTTPSFASNSCNGNGFSETTQTCVMGSNLKFVGDVVIIAFSSTGASAALSVSGCGITWSSDTSISAAGGSSQHFWGTTVNTSACTITGTSTVSGSMSVAASEYKNTSGVDVHGYDTATTFVTSPSAISCKAVTTTAANDLVVCDVIDFGAGGDTFTAGAGYAADIQTVNFGTIVESGAKAVAGSVTPTATSNTTGNFSTGTIALKP